MIGDAVNVAARLQGAAEPDTILVGGVTEQRTRGAFAFRAIPPLALKGKEQPVAAAVLLGPRATPVADVQRAPLVGRAEELGVLKGCLEELRRGRGQVAAIIGEPGLGKSRLLAELREEGKIRHVGLSNVNAGQLEQAQEIVPIASVQNRYNLIHRFSEDVIGLCEREGIGFIPWFPLATGNLARAGSSLDEMASRRGIAPGQVALAWLLWRSPVMLPIPGTSSVEHLEENVAAAAIELNEAELEELSVLSS